MATPEARRGWNMAALEQISNDATGRPILFTNARVMTLDPLIGTVVGDVLLGGPLVVGVGPGIVNAAGDDGAIVVDATGSTIVPAVVDGLALTRARAASSDGVGTITPGNAGDLLVVPDPCAADVAAALTTLLTRPRLVLALLTRGVPVIWDGECPPTRPVVPAAGVPVAQDLSHHPRTGMWIDRGGFLHQELTASGRYDETRGGRRHAFQGRYWIDGNRIDYLDDLGFWAFGEFVGDELHHAGYVMVQHDSKDSS